MKAIVTIYHGPTNNRGSRIIADDGDKNRVSVPVNNALSNFQNHVVACRHLCDKMGWKGKLVFGYLKKGMVWVWDADGSIEV
jgi:hypothetical protein